MIAPEIYVLGEIPRGKLSAYSITGMMSRTPVRILGLGTRVRELGQNLEILPPVYPSILYMCIYYF